MAFNSVSFLIFLGIVFFIYYLPLFKRIQPYVLVGAGLFFYAFANVYYCLLLVASCLINSILLRAINKSAKPRLLSASGIIINVLILVFFKYSGLFAVTILGNENEVVQLLLKMPLPLGVSFYTFQAISMLADSKKEGTKIKPVDIFLYLGFFPNSVSGPIIKYSDFNSQRKQKNFWDIDFVKVTKLLLTGYFLKVCVADNIQNYTFVLKETNFEGYSPIYLIVIVYAYAIQIFADFAGYSLIAIGLGRMFGYVLPDNFNYPYISKSITEFWRRWHISLSSWLRQYIYIPLGGNRKGIIRTYINLMIVMLVGGLWHGSEWKYLFWGGIHGLLLVLERIYKNLKKKSTETNVLVSGIKILFTFTIVSWLWLFFEMDSVSNIIMISKQIVFGWDIARDFNFAQLFMAVVYMVPVIIYHMIYALQSRGKWFAGDGWKMPIYALMILALCVNRGTESAFIYFQF